ncbi:sodium-dependent transporter [Macrococcus armenti]|uniref:sodium-dependent transporter n=1 Tax=Macrococcus armenti TaxID=2875764 RepID=UPI001CCAE212|nr:sodium-dependent transporter [Macrococcus armenti]UBH15443.1 sodium-dependent transporter [Macrococcus armenti]UBH17803.1 sodium-dependent transporter [Macrococcus armenti]UBH20068.1 sodium-dependent transporter [Macrococcus armenti]
MNEKQGFKSSIGFILASAGSAIGLGAIWKFPYIAGQYGGGAFLLEFILFTILIGLPLLITEFAIGHLGKTYSTTIFSKLSHQKFTNFIGFWGNFAAFILYAFYSVIGGWIVIFFGYYLLIATKITEQNMNFFDMMIQNPLLSLTGQFLFIMITGLIVSFGVEKGIERASKIMMPLLFILFIIIVVRALTLDGAMEGVKYFLIPRFEDLSFKGTLYAMGQSFFALSLGTTGMITYAAYSQKDTDIVSSSSWIVFMNLAISILAGLAIFPAASAFNIEATAGPGLLFIVLPKLFNAMAFGLVFYIMFLLLFLFAALTSSISLLELNLSNVIKNDASKRKTYAWLLSIIVFIVGIPANLSFGLLSHVKFGAGTIFDNMDFFVTNIFMPIGVLITTLFTGYIMHKQQLLHAFRKKYGFTHIWYYLIKFILPIVIIIVFITQLYAV